MYLTANPTFLRFLDVSLLYTMFRYNNDVLRLKHRFYMVQRRIFSTFPSYELSRKIQTTRMTNDK